MTRPFRLTTTATIVLLLGGALFLIACGSDADGNGGEQSGSTNGGAQNDQVDFALEELPEIDEEFRLLPHVMLDESFEAVEGETYALQGRVKHIRTSLFAVELIDDSKVEYNPYMPEPWIYCCSTPDEVQANLINVRFVRTGEELPVSDGDYVKPSFRLVDLITVVGTIIESSDGTPIFLATGYLIDERPELGDHVEWPEN